jgi:hypothetical protein
LNLKTISAQALDLINWSPLDWTLTLSVQLSSEPWLRTTANGRLANAAPADAQPPDRYPDPEDGRTGRTA